MKDLLKRIKKLEKTKLALQIISIEVGPGETMEEAQRRHLAENGIDLNDGRRRIFYVLDLTARRVLDEFEARQRKLRV